MVIEQETLPFWQWLLRGSADTPAALLWFLLVVACVALLALVASYLLAAVRHGPMAAGDLTYRVVTTGLKELVVVSPRRVFALARLAVKESLRRRVLVAVVVFLLILLFASWFLGTNNTQPAKLYLSFVLTATTYLVVLMALFLSAFSLPNDVKNKTIYTIVSKPVRAGEIVLGRIVGFTAVGTLLLAIMGVCSYVFVVQSLRHSHDVQVQSLVDEADREGGRTRRGTTTTVDHHRHEVVLYDDGSGAALPAHGHGHDIVVANSDGEPRYTVGKPRDMFRARVPIYGKLRFKDRQGADKAKGISVGNEWTYRSYVEGGTQAAAIWTFEGLPEDLEELPIELTLSVFRTYTGKFADEKSGAAVGILGGIVLRNPADPDKKRSAAHIFRAREYSVNQETIPRDLVDPEGNPIDLFADLVDNGKLEIEVQCLDRAQYFGMAQADLYLRARDGSFAVNFCKGYASIWVQMLLVTCFAVACSTFLSGPVAMMFTLSVIVLGFFKKFIVGVATGAVVGGGPVESLIRLVTQMNVTTEFEQGWGTTITQAIDAVLLAAVRGFAAMIPDFGSYSTVRYVSDGYDIPWNGLSQDVVASAAYLAGLFVVGYFFLRTREVAK